MKDIVTYIEDNNVVLNEDFNTKDFLRMTRINVPSFIEFVSYCDKELGNNIQELCEKALENPKIMKIIKDNTPEFNKTNISN